MFKNRRFVASLISFAVAGSLVISSVGATADTLTTPEITPAESRHRIVDLANRTILNVDPQVGTLGLTLPGQRIEPRPTATSNLPSGLFFGIGSPLMTTELPGAFITSYATGHGSQSIITIENAAAPQEFSFPLTLPLGATASIESDGSVSITDRAGIQLGGYDKPWAYDAAGNPVATSFTIVSGNLVQTIGHGANTAYPIIADPGDFWGWLRCGASVGMLVAGNMLIATKVTRLGGVPRVLRMLQDARNAEQRWGALIAIFGEYAGINDVLDHCK